MTIKKAISQLLKIVDRLQCTYNHKKFTLDGRLVGDLGEILVESKYRIKLHSKVIRHYDAKTQGRQKRNVQIKSTMKESLTFPRDHTPDYYIGVKINRDGSLTEIYNGKGNTIRRSLRTRTRPQSNFYSISIKKLAKLNKTVRTNDRIPFRGA